MKVIISYQFVIKTMVLIKYSIIMVGVARSECSHMIEVIIISGAEEKVIETIIIMSMDTSSAPLLPSKSDTEGNESDATVGSPPSYDSTVTSPTPAHIVDGGGLRRRLTLSHLKHSYTVRSLFTVKPIEAFMESRQTKTEGGSLAEKLGLVDLLGYGVGCTVGAGIYSLIGVGAGIAGMIHRQIVCLLACHGTLLLYVHVRIGYTPTSTSRARAVALLHESKHNSYYNGLV